MEKHNELMRESVLRDMSEGVMTIRFGGTITYINPAAERILARQADELVGKSFAASFFDYEENDAFNQTVLDAAYDHEQTHESIVTYFTGSETRQLRVTTSFQHDGDERIGIIVVLSDISELEELRDAVKAMERIKTLNSQLELRNKLLGETFGRFLSDEIVQQLLDTPDGLALGGKKRTLTILMSDLRGFTAISERMEAQGLLAMLNHYLAEMTDVIQEHNGTIIEFIGDGILAIFGAPTISHRHAVDAVTAAVKMQARMEAVNEWNEKYGYPVLEMGIGINTGEVIVGNIGSEKRTKYGVVGSHVNLCGRIESYTVGGQILISPRTREEITEPLEIEAQQEVFPKGVPAPLKLSLVTGIGKFSSRTQTEVPKPLETPIPVHFAVIHEKHTEAQMSEGYFVALGKRVAVLQTEVKLEQYENLQIEAGENAGKTVFAKVIRKEENGWLLRFTSTLT